MHRTCSTLRSSSARGEGSRTAHARRCGGVVERPGLSEDGRQGTVCRRSDGAAVSPLSPGSTSHRVAHVELELAQDRPPPPDGSAPAGGGPSGARRRPGHGRLGRILLDGWADGNVIDALAIFDGREGGAMSEVLIPSGRWFASKAGPSSGRSQRGRPAVYLPRMEADPGHRRLRRLLGRHRRSRRSHRNGRDRILPGHVLEILMRPAIRPMEARRGGDGKQATFAVPGRRASRTRRPPQLFWQAFVSHPSLAVMSIRARQPRPGSSAGARAAQPPLPARWPSSRRPGGEQRRTRAARRSWKSLPTRVASRRHGTQRPCTGAPNACG